MAKQLKRTVPLSWWRIFLDLIYPPKCPVCKMVVAEHGAWCQWCLAKVLAVRNINVQQHHLTFLDSCQVICEYTGGLKRLIHDMKFRRQQRYGVYLHWLITQNTMMQCFVGSHYVVPVPLHADRLKERGYNQTEAIFEQWARECNLLWKPELLTRACHTIPQWELNLVERKRNMKGAFAITQPEIVKDKSIIIVDDLITTGITLDECAKVLKKAGATAVHGLVVASGAR